MLDIKRFVFNPVCENTYVLSDESHEAAIIDCGCFTEVEWKELKRYIETQGLKPVLLLNTHLHFDHAMGNHFVCEEYGLQVRANEADFPMKEQLLDQLSLFLGPRNRHLVQSDVKYQLGAGLSEGDTVVFGHTTFKVLSTPGHTPGGICFYNEAEQVLFSGDSLFRGSIGRTDLPGGSYRDLVESLTGKILTLPSETRVFPGHGDETTISYESEFNPYI